MQTQHSEYGKGLFFGVICYLLETPFLFSFSVFSS